MSDLEHGGSVVITEWGDEVLVTVTDANEVLVSVLDSDGAGAELDARFAIARLTPLEAYRVGVTILRAGFIARAKGRPDGA